MTDETISAKYGLDLDYFVRTGRAATTDRHAVRDAYRALLELMPGAVYCVEFDPAIATSLPPDAQFAALADGVLTDCNEACARALGARHPGEVIGLRLARLLPFDEPAVRALFDAFVAGGYRAVDAETPLAGKNGVRRFFVNNAAGDVVHGRLRRICGSLRDVTDRHRSEDRIRQSESRLNEAQRLARIGSWEVDHTSSGRFIWSDEVFRIFEVDPESFVPTYETFMDRVHPDDRATIDAAYAESARTGTPYFVEHRLLMPDGSVKYVSERSEFIFDDAGKHVRTIGTIQDVTDRRESQATIAKLMSRLEALTSVAFDGIAIGEGGTLLECSPQLADALGYRCEEVENQPIIEFVAPAFRAIAQSHFSTESPAPFELRMLRRDGTTLPVEVVLAAIVVDGREAQAYAVRDISHRKKLQSEVIAVSEEERHRIGRDLHDSVGQLLFGASLSLRSVCDQLQEAGSELLPTVQSIKDIIVDAIDETRRVSHLLVPAIYSRNNLSLSLTKLVATVNEVSPIRLRAECSYTKDIPTDGTAEQLYRITQECISNALKHSAAREVIVRLYADDGLLRLEVDDDGVGIDADAALRSTGLGIRSMRYRAGLIEGILEIMPGDRIGTRIRCTCPL